VVFAQLELKRPQLGSAHSRKRFLTRGAPFVFELQCILRIRLIWRCYTFGIFTLFGVRTFQFFPSRNELAVQAAKQPNEKYDRQRNAN